MAPRLLVCLLLASCASASAASDVTGQSDGGSVDAVARLDSRTVVNPVSPIDAWSPTDSLGRLDAVERVDAVEQAEAGSSGDASQGTDSGTDAAASHTPGGVFSPGVCTGGKCGVAAVKRYNLNVSDSGTTAYCKPNCVAGNAAATNTPKTIAPAIFISRPTNLSTSTPAPLLVAFSGSVGGDPNWLQAAADDGFVVVQIPTTHNCSGGSGCQYAYVDTIRVPTTAAAYQSCGTGGNAPCDDVPWVTEVISALESCATATGSVGGSVGTWVSGTGYNGAPPCQNINPKEVFAEGGSRGGGMTLATVCDTRTSNLIAAATDISDIMIGESTHLPNCPALLPYDPSTCVGDCVSATPNTKLSLQFIWGDEDPNFPPSTNGTANPPDGYCDRTVPSNDCLGVGYCDSTTPGACNSPGQMEAWGLIQLATTALGHALGCSATPSSNITAGLTGKIDVTTYDACTNAGAATQTVHVTGGFHMPDTWSASTGFGTTTSGIACESGCTDSTVQNGTLPSDGLVEPFASWNFWTTHLP
jgi:hypothetical protein